MDQSLRHPEMYLSTVPVVGGQLRISNLYTLLPTFYRPRFAGD